MALLVVICGEPQEKQLSLVGKLLNQKATNRLTVVDLFNQNQIKNILPYDGTVIYYGYLFGKQASEEHFNQLLNTIEWKNDEAIIFGKHIITQRKAAWYGDESYNYTYSNTTKTALPWTPQLVGLKNIVENTLQTSFNSCLLNLYHNGNEGMAWHSDDEKSLGKNCTIASLSFGAERKFLLKHKTSKETVPIFLQNGSLLVMKGTTQTHWWHRLPKTKMVTKPRINLTFRTINIPLIPS